MTCNSDSGLSRRKFLIVSGAAGPARLAGYTKDNTDGGSSGGDFEGEDSSDDGSNELSGTIDIAGSSTVFLPATVMVGRFQTEHSEVNINLQSTDSGGDSANYFCTGQTSFNNVPRLIKGEGQD